jgi:hypothetical protein
MAKYPKGHGMEKAWPTWQHLWYKKDTIQLSAIIIPSVFPKIIILHFITFF